ncbi:MAG: GAF domain-containing protein, partial [Deltaproteobacteria bacterium]|nr:GAF domain-containing protein [Deltaproteobacteria bacterium]
MGRELYNSRLVKNYLEYLERFYPEIDRRLLLKRAGISPSEVEDPGCWFTQEQTDKFNKILVSMTNNPEISREVGRFSVASRASGVLKQYALGFASPLVAYAKIAQFAPTVTKGVDFSSQRLGQNQVEVIVTPKPGVVEKPYQCDNRLGMLEALAKGFTGAFAEVQHPECIHHGGGRCRYLVSWPVGVSRIWKRVSLLYAGALLLGSAALFPYLSFQPWLTATLTGVSLLGFLVSLYCHTAKQELSNTMESQGNAAKDLLAEMDIRYNNLLLLHEMGREASAILDTHKLLNTIVQVMQRRLDFDRGMIMLADEERDRLIYMAGFGYDPSMEAVLRKTSFHLNKPDSRGVAVLAFRRKMSFLVNDLNEIEQDLSPRSLEFIRKMGVQSFVCVPICHEEEPLGVLFVYNLHSKRP